MKNLTRHFLAAAIICLVASQSTAFAQFRMGKSGGSRGGSRSSFSMSRGSSQRGSSGGSFSHRTSVSRSGSRSLTSSQNRLGGSSSQKGITKGFTGTRGSSWNRGLSKLPQTKLPQTKLPQTRLPQTKLPHTRLPQTKIPQTKLPQTRLPSINKLPLLKQPQGSVKQPLHKLPLNKLPQTKLPLNKRPQSNGHPFLNGGVKGQVQKHITQKFQPASNWKNVVHNIIQHNRRHWCHTRPATCHWWVSYCTPIAHCNINDLVICDWNRVQCAPVVQVGAPVQQVQWYLGMKGMLLPGKGIGIDAVEPGSPAEQVGLRPGMVLTVCNGIPMIDEAAMAEAIRISGGVLNMTILSADGSQVLEGTVRMVQVAAVSF